MASPTRRCLWLMMAAVMATASSLLAAPPPPPTLPVTVTFKAPGVKEAQTIDGELKFETLPVLVDGKKAPLEKKTLIPNELDAVEFKRLDATQFDFNRFKGRKTLALDFDRLVISYGEAGDLQQSLSAGIRANVAEAGVMDLDDGAQAADPSRSLELIVEVRTELKEIKASQIQGMSFKTPAGINTEVMGRFVDHNKKAKGSNGAVRVATATLLGGAGDDRIIDGAFLADGSVAVLMNTADVSFLRGGEMTVLGKDAALPAPAASDKPGKPAADPKTTGVIVRLGAEATAVTGVTRLPWGAGMAEQLRTSPAGALYLTGRVGPGFGGVAAGRREEVPAPAGAKATAGDSFVMRLSADATKAEWVIVFRGTGVDLGFRRGDEVLVETGKRYWIVRPEGSVSAGPDINGEGVGWRARGPLTVNPADNSFYIGGEYHSGTGHEPYRNPLLHKFNAEGRCVWTAWNWTGPIIGMPFSRQVSDSAVRRVVVLGNGDLLVVGWSDGGNSVFSNPPYDLERTHNKYHWINSIWGAGVLSVGHLLRMDAETMDIKAGTYFIGFHPFTNKPNSGSVNDLLELEDGRIVVVGGVAYAMTETPDAWVTPWSVQMQRDASTARPHSGPCFAVFDGELKQLLFSSLVPNVGGMKVRARGSRVLLTGSVRAEPAGAEESERTLRARALQGDFGGGTSDGYVMLIETASTKDQR